MRIFIDTNIFLDVALKREIFYQNSAKVLESFEDSQNDAFIAWHSLSNIHYILASYRSAKEAMDFVRDMVLWVKIPPATEQTARRALDFDIKDKDFEDALQFACAEACSANCIVTRNVTDFEPVDTDIKIFDLYG